MSGQDPIGQGELDEAAATGGADLEPAEDADETPDVEAHGRIFGAEGRVHGSEGRVHGPEGRTH